MSDDNVIKGPGFVSIEAAADGAPKPPGNVEVLGGETVMNVPCERVLNGALAEELEEVLVIGWKDGELYTACSYNHGGTMMLRMEQTKARLLRCVE